MASGHERISCRLCGGSAAPVFRKRLLGKHDVGYYLCERCGALQTEAPWWLQEAYEPMNERFDTGQAIRSIANAAFVMALVRRLGLEREKVIDFGSGSGLFTRLLRDVGVDAWGYDPYSLPRLALGFRTDDLSGAALVNLCEVAEHFDQPVRYFDAIFGSGALAVVVQTGLLERADPDWEYLSPEHGQHVFFYAARTFEFIAARYGRVLLPLAGYAVFVDPSAATRLADPESGRVRPEAEPRLNDSLVELFNLILAHGYEYALKDNRALLGGRR